MSSAPCDGPGASGRWAPGSLIASRAGRQGRVGTGSGPIVSDFPITLDGMVFRPSPGSEHAAADGVTAAAVDYRLARDATVAAFRSGELSHHDACDAHPELVRAGREIGTETTVDCPICQDAQLRHVTYVFGPRLPSHGRCISLRGELARIGRRKGHFTAYVVEVCPRCSWNHLVRRYPVPRSEASAS